MWVIMLVCRRLFAIALQCKPPPLVQLSFVWLYNCRNPNYFIFTFNERKLLVKVDWKYYCESYILEYHIYFIEYHHTHNICNNCSENLVFYLFSIPSRPKSSIFIIPYYKCHNKLFIIYQLCTN